MARPRTPVAKALVEGAGIKNRKRHAGRKAPRIETLGGPSRHLTVYQHRAFERFRAELPWLKESHRVLVEIASQLRGAMLDPGTAEAPSPGLSLQGLQELRRCLSAMGATPSDESKVNWSGGEEDDPDDQLFGRPPGDRPH
jgi:hypothetical protein